VAVRGRKKLDHDIVYIDPNRPLKQTHRYTQPVLILDLDQYSFQAL
jgi:hypothetical protein